jgi:hypothetical protein
MDARNACYFAPRVNLRSLGISSDTGPLWVGAGMNIQEQQRLYELNLLKATSVSLHRFIAYAPRGGMLPSQVPYSA